jgi:hypothetical protein
MKYAIVIPIGAADYAAARRFLVWRPKQRQALHTLVPSRIIRRLIYVLPYVVQAVERSGRIDPRLREKLAPQIAEEIDALEKLIGRDLSAWKR